LTAFVNADNGTRCTNIGMAEVMNKPAQSSEICRVIRNFCPEIKIAQRREVAQSVTVSFSSLKAP